MSIVADVAAVGSMVMVVIYSLWMVKQTLTGNH